jgi:signal transduction histidine kinase
MRARIEALGGTLSQDTQAGTKLAITIPLATNAGGQPG